MTVIPAEFVELPKEKMAETTMEWPHVFAKLPFNHEIMLEKFDANIAMPCTATRWRSSE
jgi:L-fucose isomerase